MDISSQFSVARELLQQGELEQALAAVDRVVGLFGKSVEALELEGEIREAIVARNRSSEAEAQIWFDRGYQFHVAGDFENAIAFYDQALKIKPDLHEAWNSRGTGLYQLGRYEMALASYNESLRYQPDYYLTWCNRGTVLCDHLGRYEEALKSYDKALKNKLDFGGAWAGRGNVLLCLRHYEDAIYSCDKALHHESDSYKTWGNRSIAAFFDRGKGEPNAYTLKHPELNQRGYPGEVASLTVGLIYCPADTHPLGHGDLQRELGDAHWDHALIQSNPRYYRSEALKAYGASLGTLTAIDHPEERLQTLQKLIRTHLALTELPDARHYQTEGITLFQQLRAIARDKRQFEAQFSNFSRTEIDLLIGENAPTKALEQAEFYKNRALTWILDDWQESVLSPSYS